MDRNAKPSRETSPIDDADDPQKFGRLPNKDMENLRIRHITRGGAVLRRSTGTKRGHDITPPVSFSSLAA